MRRKHALKMHLTRPVQPSKKAPYPAWHSQQYLLESGNMGFMFTFRIGLTGSPEQPVID